MFGPASAQFNYDDLPDMPIGQERSIARQAAAAPPRIASGSRLPRVMSLAWTDPPNKSSAACDHDATVWTRPMRRPRSSNPGGAEDPRVSLSPLRPLHVHCTHRDRDHLRRHTRGRDHDHRG